MKSVVKTDKAPAAIGPYSQAIIAGNFIFTAGQIAISPQTGTVIEGDVADQTRQVLENLKVIIEEAGSSLSSVAKMTVYLTQPDHFTPMNDVYATYFKTDPPARTTVFINSLPKGVLVEIDAIAQL
jgi:2-iminobutanoate/2-iminopropanoate deaminase